MEALDPALEVLAPPAATTANSKGSANPSPTIRLLDALMSLPSHLSVSRPVRRHPQRILYHFGQPSMKSDRRGPFSRSAAAELRCTAQPPTPSNLATVRHLFVPVPMRPRPGPWWVIKDVELATLGLGALAQHRTAARIETKPPSLHQTQGGSTDRIGGWAATDELISPLASALSGVPVSGGV